MNKEWTEEEIRQALFGNAEISAPMSTAPVEEFQLDVAAAPVSKVARTKIPDTIIPSLLAALVQSSLEAGSFSD